MDRAVENELLLLLRNQREEIVTGWTTQVKQRSPSVPHSPTFWCQSTSAHFSWECSLSPRKGRKEIVEQMLPRTHGSHLELYTVPLSFRMFQKHLLCVGQYAGRLREANRGRPWEMGRPRSHSGSACLWHEQTPGNSDTHGFEL